jgi:hypothetical protein
MCDKTSINFLQQSAAIKLKCYNEKIDYYVAELDQKTKLILYMLFQNHPIILLSQFCFRRDDLNEVIQNLVYCVLYFLAYHAVVIAMTATANINLTEGT